MAKRKQRPYSGVPAEWYKKEAVVASIILAIGAIAAALAGAVFSGSSDSPAPPPAQVQVIPIVGLDAEQIAGELAKVLAPDLNSELLTHNQSGGGLSSPGPENILLLLDNSGSIHLFDTTHVLDELVGDFRLHDNISILAFDERVARVLPFGHYSLDEIRAQLREFRQFHGKFTDIRAAFAVAEDLFSNLPFSDRRRLIFVSDFMDDPPGEIHPEGFTVPRVNSAEVELVVLDGSWPIEIEDPDNVRVRRVSAPLRHSPSTR